MSSISKRRKEGSRAKIKSMGDHKEFLKRITKTLYYGQLPSLLCLSLPVTEISCEVWSEAQRGRSLRRLHTDAAASIARQACVSPCALVLAVLYLERLRACNPDYLATAAPADLFLVSLMVGNKFLQDDGEDDEVICAEWAESGGLELKLLKKLELEFLSAIEWNVFVNEKKFGMGLSWLERRVALKQAQLRGFFTYSDLAATCGGGAGGAALLAGVAAACAGCLASLLALVASTLVVSHACFPAPTPTPAVLHHHLAPSTALETNTTNTHNYQPELTASNHIPNSTLDLLLTFDSLRLSEPRSRAENIMCCSKWLHHHETAPKRNWYNSIVVYDWKSLEPWWSTTSVFNWLYQSSLVNPMQRWLEKVNMYADLFSNELSVEPHTRHVEQCHEYVEHGEQQRCVHQWLNLSKLSAWLVSMSDR